MKLIKTHKIANRKKGQVVFGSQPGGKWMFRVGGYEKLTKVPGGLEIAERIAMAFHKSWLRTEGKPVKFVSDRIDGICHNTVDRLLKCRTLADYKPLNGSWDNPNPAHAAEPSVKMVEPPKNHRSKDTIPWHQAPKGISAEDLAVEAPTNTIPVAVEPELAAK
jgi:hypothetical protein